MTEEGQRCRGGNGGVGPRCWVTREAVEGRGGEVVGRLCEF
jgi:hypothetical protein